MIFQLVEVGGWDLTVSEECLSSLCLLKITFLAKHVCSSNLKKSTIISSSYHINSLKFSRFQIGGHHLHANMIVAKLK